jgi:LEA14-like dessication related protein
VYLAYKNIKNKNMIHHATDQFDFSTIHLGNPSSLPGGSFFTKINNTIKDEPLYVYTPSCTSKQGVVSSNSRGYLDFMFTSGNSNFIQWINALEERLQNLLFEKKDTWFIGDDMELDDIQNAFIPILKAKGNQYMVRGYLQGKHFKETIQVYNEDEIPVPLTSIQENSQLISILDISGIKFNQKCFQIMIHIRQLMIIEKTSFNNCLIKHNVKKSPEVMTDTIVLKTPTEVYKNALEKAKAIKEELERADAIAEELRITYDILE